MIRRLRRGLAIGVVVTTTALAGCGDDSGGGGGDESAGPSAGEAEWSYSGKTGPKFWDDLDPAFRECGEGRRQSPINLADPVEGGIGEFEPDYRTAPGTEENNGHAIEVALRNSGEIIDKGTPFALEQFHFHVPSEHAVDGERSPAEMHLVHANEDEELAVVGVRLEVGEENEVLAQALEDVPDDPGDEQELEGEIDPTDLLPDDGSGDVFRYDGSLTTPPCSEGVLWTVYEEPIKISQEQLDELASAFNDDARPLQPLNGRELIEGRAG